MKNIINFTIAQRLGWYGHIERMQETRMAKAMHSWKPISKSQREDHRYAGRMMLKRYTEVKSAKLGDLCPG